MKTQVLFLVLLSCLTILIAQSCTYGPSDSRCDERCLSKKCNVWYSQYDCCDGCQPYNVNYYQELTVNTNDWTGTPTTRCSEICPPYQYQDSTGNVYKCKLCDRNCTTCSGPSNTQCKTCAPTSYQLNTTACYNQGVKSYGFNPCPNGFYGIQNTMRCEACPSGTTACNIFIQTYMPGANYITTKVMDNLPCAIDPYCTYLLKSYTCSSALGYFLEEGFCFTKVCRKYQLYNSTSSSFDSSLCYCKEGYYSAGVTCSRCHFTCKTCTSVSISSCTSCPIGWNLAGGVCSRLASTVMKQDWFANGMALTGTSGTFTTNITGGTLGTLSSTCGSFSWLFGSSSYTVSFTGSGSITLDYSPVKLTYSSTGFSNGGHYGIHFRATLLFVDQWKSTMSLFFRQSNRDIYSYNYGMEEMRGQYLCGLNYHDHIDVVDFSFTHNTTTVSLQISASVVTHSWGIKDILIQELVCDPSCVSCNGPSASECTQCKSTTYQVLVDNDCVCDITNGWYLDAGTCTQTCSGTKYKDNTTRSCVTVCQFPLMFHYNGNCYEKCPSSASYRRWNDSFCVSDCFNTSITDDTANLYKYDGSDKVCYNTCPAGMFGDPESQTCVAQCPSTSSQTDYLTYGAFADGKFCRQVCTASKYAFTGTRTCVTQCPAGFYVNTKNYGNGNGVQNLCQQTCSISLGGSKLYGDNTTNPYSCVDLCPDDTYADIATHMCLGNCNTTSYKQSVSSNTVRTCRQNCQSSTYHIFGNNITHHCVNAFDCPNNTYGDYQSSFCELICTDPDYFGDNSTRKCSTTCTSGFKQRDNKTCVVTCPEKNNAGNPEFGDPISHFCQEACTDSDYYTDRQTNRQCVQKCAATPMQSYGLNGQCVFNCSSTTWADPFHTNRICTYSCTYSAGGTKSYGYNFTRKCVQTCPDTHFGQIIAAIPLCIFVCQNSEYGDPLSNLCVANCPSPYYGDPTGNRTCVLECLQSGYYALNLSAENTPNRANRTCVQVCEFGWADNITRMCAQTPFDCSPGLYAHQTNHKCVFPIECTGFADPVSRKCVSECYVNDTEFTRYFGDKDTHMCVLICPKSPDYFGDNSTKQCQTTCTNTNQLKDTQNNRRCVVQTNCSRLPVALFGDTAAGTCVTARNCTDGTFGDNNTKKCESDCQGTNSLLYADPILKECVNVCQPRYYSHNSSANIGVCSLTCPIDFTPSLWADNITKKCEPQCSPKTYGVNWTDTDTPSYRFGTCQKQCPLNQFARDADNLCVSNCGPDHWGEIVARKCLTDPKQCPEGYYGDNQTHMCVVSTDCSLVNLVQYVADNETKQCKPSCPPLTDAFVNWADMEKKLCVVKCPYNKFGDNSTLKCKDACNNTNTADGTRQYADSQLRICVKVCSAYPFPTYGQNTTWTCVEARYCPADQFAEDFYYKRVCISRCPDPRVNSNYDYMFADNISKKCVFECPTRYYGNIVAQSNYGECVAICPTFANSTLKFADNSTKRCVKECPQAENTFGDQVSLRCVKVCPAGWYAQKTHRTLPKRYCVQTCDQDTWKQNIKRTCVQTPFDCPTINGYHWYALNSSTQCVQTCPISSDLWGQNTTYTCESTCEVGTFKYEATRVCIDLCPASLDDDGLFSDQGKCYTLCITPAYYRDPQNKRSCQPGCSFSPTKYYADDTTMRCVLHCPSYPSMYYAYDSDRSCRLDCPSNTMRDTKNLKCVSSCSNNAFFDENSDSCVSECPSDYSTGKIWYGDKTLTIPKCVEAADCPSTYFADDNVQLCVQTCSQNQWKYGKNCVTFCPDGYYGNKDTGFCVIPSGCQIDHYAQNSSQLCVSTCTGTFADTNNKVCLNVCPDNYFADSATHLCSATCTNNVSITLYKNIGNKTCISNCAQGLFLNTLNNNCQQLCNDPYYQDPTTQICVETCPSTPPLYGRNDTNKCVEECNNVTNQYKWKQGRLCVTSCPGGLLKNNFTRFCVKQCINNTYADVEYCVTNCTPKYSLEDPNICTSNCPFPYFKDPTTFKCVLECPTFPQQYYKVITSTERRCDLNCPTNQYRSDLTYTCVSLCTLSPPTYSDITSGNCTSVCSDGYYAHKQTRSCKTKCPGTLLAEPTTRTCVAQCRNGTDTYGDKKLAIPQCVTLCFPGTFANPYKLTCDEICGTNPKTYGFDNNTHRICVQSCPYPYIANNHTHLCQIECLSVQYPYLDKASKSCVSVCTSPMYQFAYLPTGQTINGTCLKFCPTEFFAYLGNNSCVSKCPDGWYGDIENQTCYQNCTLVNDRFADNAINMCVDECKKYNQSYDSFADLYSRQCVIQCPEDKLTIKDNNTRKCEPRCTQLDEFADWTTGYCVKMCPDGWYADPVTLTCVKNCSLYSQKYIYQTNRSCVSNCLNVGLYQNQDTRTCVDSFGCPDGFWGLNSSGVCVDNCPTTPDLFGDIVTKTCVSACPNETAGSENYYADFSTRQCVKVCPQTPSLFARNDTRTCVSECPPQTYADNYTRRCVEKCSLIPGQTYADNSTNRCVKTCPSQPNYFASNQTYECVLQCTTLPKMYMDYSTRKCVENCPGGDIDTYAYQTTRFCVRKCPGSTYMENSTRTCQTICKTGFADPKSKFCIKVCPPYTYGHAGTGGQKACKPECPTQTPAIYAEDSNNLCMTECLLQYNTYRDPTTKRCVKICPINDGMFADNVSRICRTQCSPSYYSDYSTRYCVSKCPEVPALFAILDTRVCIGKCPANSWADNKTRTCVIDKCPSIPDTFGDNSTWTCVSQCPTKPMSWADNFTRTCVPKCPSSPDFYSDNFTRRCVYNCSQETYADSTTRKCVQTCPEGWFGINSTRRCQRTCPDNEFADDLLNLCVKKCSVDPIFYGNPDNHICVEQCPPQNYSFGNPLSQQCVNYQADGFSGCPVALFADNYTRLCVQVCPFLINDTRIDTYGDNSTWKCVKECPAGTQDTFADNSTMRCVKTCPAYPEYYSDKYSRRCVSLCLQANLTYSGSFADNSTRKCVQKCPDKPDFFSDNSTRRCVKYCPKNPLTFADYSTRRCVLSCPSSPYDIYGDHSTGRCVGKCPEQQQTYSDHSTRLCVKVCPAQYQLYGQNQTNKCVSKCPNGSFSDNASRLCIAVCPQYPETYGDPSSNQCVDRCPPDPDLYADSISQECVQRCPPGYYAESNTRKCLPDCPQQRLNYADNKTNRCVSKCPDSPINFATYGDNSTQDCVLQCPLVPLTYADNITRICLKICNNQTNGGYADNSTRVCVQKCPDGSYGDITTRYCVRYCPEGWYSDLLTNMCVRQCFAPFYSDPTTEKCVVVCPVSQLLFGEPFGRTCTPSCPEKTYAAFDTQTCVFQCPSKSQTKLGYDTFGYNETNECIDQCPIPLYGWPVTYVCVGSCPDPYYENITDHRCYKCPQECSSCYYPQLCLTCVKSFFLYAGSCVQSCPTFPVITYANPNGECGTSFQCTPGYFALNATKSCVNVCPDGYYKNNFQQTCDACQRGCNVCTNSSYCIICNEQVAIWYQFECYTYCSPLKRYYADTGCVAQCPDGTFLNLTSCQACSSVCKTCSVQPQNCINCASGLYLSNNLCVEKCPNQFKAVNQNGSLVCKSCSIVNCASAPLTYQISQYVDNFQYKFLLKFSEPVNIKDEIDKIIAIKKKNTRRLLETSYQYLDYTIIDHGDGTYEFILNDYDPTQGDNQFELQILNPGLITSESGQLPQNTRSSIQIDSATSYSIKDYNKAFMLYNIAIILLSIILLLATFWTQYSIWTPMFDYLQIMMAVFLVNVILPPTPMYALGAFHYANFSFLPNFFTKLLPTPTYNSKIMNSSVYSVLKDLIFLRSMGQIYLILIVLTTFLLLVLGMSKIFFNKSIKSWSKKFIRETFWKKHLYAIVHILFLPVFLMGLISIKSYSIKGPILGFSAFSSWLFIALMLVAVGFFIYKVRKLSKDSPITYLMLQKAYNFITFQKIILINNDNNKFIHEKNQIDLSKGREPRINQLRILPFDLQTRMGPVQISGPFVNLLHKLLVAIFITAAYQNAIVQILFIILVNIIYSIYLLVKKPYIRIAYKELTSQIIIHNMMVISITLLIILAFKIQMNSLPSTTKNSIGLAICLITVYGVTSNFIYFAFRTYNYYFQNVWKKFVASQLFKDNYTVEHYELVKKYNEQEALLKKKVRPKTEFLEAIKVQKGEALANMVLRDPNHMGSNDQYKDIKLRPNKNEIAQQDIGNMFKTLHNQPEKSQKSAISSSRLPKHERQNVRKQIFKDIEAIKEQQYYRVKINQKPQHDIQSNQDQNHSKTKSQLLFDNLSETQDHDLEQEFDFEYIEEEYPENTSIEQIMKGCKKGDIVMP